MSPRERFGYASICGLLLLAFGFIGARHLRQPAPIVFQNAPIASTSGPIQSSQSAAQALVPNSEKVVVHVAGAVKNPGVFHLPADSRVIDAVHAAGGPTANANLDSVNLAARLVDSTQVRILTKNESQAAVAMAEHRPSKRASVDGPIDKSGSIEPLTISPEYLPSPSKAAPQTIAEDSSTPPTHGSRAKKTVSEVDVNTATLEEMQSLPGVGPAMAQKIIDFREEHGTFKTADDLLGVQGIGPKKLEKMRPYVKL